jgi:hypothetical protein
VSVYNYAAILRGHLSGGARGTFRQASVKCPEPEWIRLINEDKNFQNSEDTSGVVTGIPTDHLGGRQRNGRDFFVQRRQQRTSI